MPGYLSSRGRHWTRMWIRERGFEAWLCYDTTEWVMGGIKYHGVIWDIKDGMVFRYTYHHQSRGSTFSQHTEQGVIG
jgi:hypothetical protein